MPQRTDSPFVIAASALSAPYTALSGVARLLTWPLRAINRSYRMRHTEAALNSLDPRILRDIGIEGASIHRIARASVDHPTVDPRQSTTWR